MATTSIGNDRGTGSALEKYPDAVLVRDDKKLYFGNDGDVSLSFVSATSLLDVSGDTSFLKNNAESSDIMLSDSVSLSVDTRWSKMVSASDHSSDVVLANGTPGQILNVTLSADGGSDCVLKPTTGTGWASITFADAGDTATLQYIDDTMGWVIISAHGDSTQPAVSR